MQPTVRWRSSTQTTFQRRPMTRRTHRPSRAKRRPYQKEADDLPKLPTVFSPLSRLPFRARHPSFGQSRRRILTRLWAWLMSAKIEKGASRVSNGASTTTCNLSLLARNHSVGAKHPQAVPSDHAELDPMSCPTRIDAVTEKPWQCESFQLPSNEQCKLQLTVHEPLYGSGLSVAALMYFVPLLGLCHTYTFQSSSSTLLLEWVLRTFTHQEERTKDYTVDVSLCIRIAPQS